MNLFWKQNKNLELSETDLENNVTHAFLILLKENKPFLNKLFKKIKVKDSIKKIILFIFKYQKN